MKKVISILIALMMVLSMATAVFAADTGSITVNGVSANANYAIYKLLDLESYNTTSGAYSYKVNADWINFFKDGTGAMDYFAIDSAGYITWVGSEADSRVAAFAKLALQYAKDNGISSVQDTDDMVITGNSGKFSNLELGYYLIDSSMGALCGLTTTNPNASINAKNGTPTIDKQVQEDSTGNYGSTNTADIGQDVCFMTTINVHAGAENYILHDVMSAGLTYKQVDKVEFIDSSDNNNVTTVDAAMYTVKTGAAVTDGCTFEVHFTKEFCDSLEINDKIIVYYTAMLNRHAVVGPESGSEHGNPNETWLNYGENNTTTHDSTKTYTFGIDIVKTDSQNTLLDGAEFKIYDAETNGNEIAVVPLLNADDTTPVLDENGNPVYRRARAEETGVSIVVKDGMVTVVGFDNGTYYLEETKAPDGYNKLTSRKKFEIADKNLDAVFNNDTYSTGSGVHVVNKTGSMLPETGGIGTVLFTVFGSMAALSTGVLLVTKKRMSMIEE